MRQSVHSVNFAALQSRQCRGRWPSAHGEAGSQRRRKTSDLVEGLVEIATVRLEEAAAEMRRAFGKEGVIIETRILRDSDGPENARDYWKWQIAQTAKHHGYFAQLDRPKRWVGLRLALPGMEREDARLIVSFHAVGRAADLQAVTAFLTGPLDRKAGPWALGERGRLRGPFQVRYRRLHPGQDQRALQIVAREDHRKRPERLGGRPVGNFGCTGSPHGRRFTLR